MAILSTSPDRKYEFAEGRNFKQDEFFTAVIGSQVARDAGIKVGDDIQPSHGAPEGHKHDPFEVVGILKRTGTPADRAVFVNMEGFYLMGGHSRKWRQNRAARRMPRPLRREVCRSRKIRTSINIRTA